MSYFSVDEQLERAASSLPAPWGLAGAVQRVGSVARLDLHWQRPPTTLEGYRVLLLAADGWQLAGQVQAATSNWQGELGAGEGSFTLAVAAYRGEVQSAPSVPLTLTLNLLPLQSQPVAESRAVVLAATPPPQPIVVAQVIAIEDDLAALDIALAQAQAHIGPNGVFVRFR